MTALIPADHLEKTWIFHITAVENLRNILQAGSLFSNNSLPCNHTSIANEEVQRHRATKQVLLPPGGVIHDYVPFYFAPRSPMLYANHRGNMANARPQDEIVHLVSTAQAIDGANLPYVFYDHHAVKAFSQVYNKLSDLDKIDWELFFEPQLMGGYAKYWHSVHDSRNPKWIMRMEVRMAEFLVYQRLSWEYIKGIAVRTQAQADAVQTILSEYGDTTTVKVIPQWYYY